VVINSLSKAGFGPGRDHIFHLGETGKDQKEAKKPGRGFIPGPERGFRSKKVFYGEKIRDIFTGQRHFGLEKGCALKNLEGFR